MCMHAQEVLFFQIRSIKKPVTFFKIGCKKIVSIIKYNKKNCLQVPKMVTPLIKNSGPSLNNSVLMCPNFFIALSQ